MWNCFDLNKKSGCKSAWFGQCSARSVKNVKAGYKCNFALSESLETFISRFYGCIWLGMFVKGVDKWKKLQASNYIYFKSRLLSEMVAAVYLVSFLYGDTALGFCDLINKNKQSAVFSQEGGRNYNISKSLSSKCVGSIYHVAISHITVEDSRQYFLLSTVIYHWSSKTGRKGRGEGRKERIGLV